MTPQTKNQNHTSKQTARTKPQQQSKQKAAKE
jgi:hypothetical protein